jgi:hypothetical protein
MNLKHKSLQDAVPGDFITGGRILQIDGKLAKVRRGRHIHTIELNEQTIIFDQASVDSKTLLKGQLYFYDYCRGITFKGIAMLRGIDDHEAWWWGLGVYGSLKGLLDDEGNPYKIANGGWFKNHTANRNFVVPVDEHYKLIPVELDLELGNI